MLKGVGQSAGFCDKGCGNGDGDGDGDGELVVVG